MDSQVDINSCTNECTHSKQGVKMRWLGHKQTAILCIRSGPDLGSQVHIITCTDACTHSKQSEGTNEVTGTQTQWTEMRWLGHKHTGIQRHPGFHETMHRECYTHQQAGRQKFMYWYMYTFETRCQDHNQGDWDTNTVTHRGTQLSM